MHARSLMTPDPFTVSGDTLLGDAVALMEEHRIRHLAVVHDGLLIGVLSDRELMKATGWLTSHVMEDLELEPGTVRDVLRPMPLTVAPEDDARRVAERLVHWGIGCTPVVEKGRLLGIITETDLLRVFVERRRAGELGDAADPPVSACMVRDPDTIDPTAQVAYLADYLDSADYRHLPVTDGERLLGIVSDRDVRMAVGRGMTEDTPVSEIMARDPVTIGPDEPVSRAAELMRQNRFSALPVEEEARLMGLITSTDVLEHCARVL